MERDDYIAEKNRIYHAAEQNGYKRCFVEKILRKHEKKKWRKNNTTLEPEKEQHERISLPYYPKITNTVQSTLRKHGFHVVYKSESTLKDLLCNLKDRIPPDEKSGIYQIPCKDCTSVYIGQTRRKFKIRLREHKNAVDNERANESSVAAHALTQAHCVDWEKAKIIRNVRKASQLNAWESMYISTSDSPLMNEEDAPISSQLFHLTKLITQQNISSTSIDNRMNMG
ncbi:uncharacterized protein LOC129765564 [Toxorhynchites rutilus septentrionalis]|uniref:uncharacterized protein LOC129765564 n=1 Tax=Toxorhynchites rutilus septentrionalis TaxID=329112 RepID=UPI00247A3D5D|nr:uncharacterized protein LOC129765564 [Toxorhynchites rutilus septentrionalis]